MWAREMNNINKGGQDVKTFVKIGVMVLSLSALLVGCASSQVKVAKTSLQGVHTIAIVSVPNPKQYTVMDAGSLKAAMGAVGGLMMVADAAHNQKGLMGAIARTRFSYGRELTRDLQAALRADGYRTRVITVRNKDPKKFLANYNGLLGHGVDAVLDVETPVIGYETQNWATSSFWRPAAQVKLRLTTRTGSGAAYEEKFMYGYHNPFMSGTDLDAPKKFHFADKKAMESASDSTLIAGLKDSSRAIASAVQAKLSR